MTTTRPRRAAALLLAATLLLAAGPAVAAPPAEGAGEAWTAPRLVDTLAAWLAALWPGGAPDATPVAAVLESEADPAGVFTADTQLGSEINQDGDATADPKRGSEIDPDG